MEEQKETKRQWKIKPRSLTHKEYKKMFDEGFSYEQIIKLIDENGLVEAMEKGFARQDFFIDEIYGDPTMREWPQHELLKFIEYTMRLTIGAENEDEEIKN